MNDAAVVEPAQGEGRIRQDAWVDGDCLVFFGCHLVPKDKEPF